MKHINKERLKKIGKVCGGILAFCNFIVLFTGQPIIMVVQVLIEKFERLNIKNRLLQVLNSVLAFLIDYKQTVFIICFCVVVTIIIIIQIFIRKESFEDIFLFWGVTLLVGFCLSLFLWEPSYVDSYVDDEDSLIFSPLDYYDPDDDSIVIGPSMLLED